MIEIKPLEESSDVTGSQALGGTCFGLKQACGNDSALFDILFYRKFTQFTVIFRLVLQS